jgi:hypothetical protein
MEEKAKLEGMIQYRDEMIIGMADEYGLNRMGENDDDEDDDDNDEGDSAAPPATAPPPVPMLPATAPEVTIIEEEENPVEMVSEQEVPEELEIIALELELEPLQPHLFNVLVRDYEESPMRMMDDLDDPTEASYDVNEWFPKDGSNDQD